MAYDNILYEVDGPMALATINRPGEKHNAISLATLENCNLPCARPNKMNPCVSDDHRHWGTRFRIWV
ncbi:MAG: hypothetical protein CM1200mP9_01310 [Gammaproteobacteria bacterium]|nr:MAG: hypothetical protein CM1200mP9_01310 [Gammaproteobacteria bacterium]